MGDKKLITLGVGILAFLAVFYLIFFLKEGITNETPEEKKSEEIVQDFSHWQEYRSTVGEFTASFPTIPSHSSEAVTMKGVEKKGVNHAFLSQEPDGTGLMVRILQYPEDYKIEDAWVAIREPFDLLLTTNEGAVAREIRKSEFQGNQALIFGVENEVVRIKGETILAGNSLYTLLYYTPVTLYDEKVWEKFISSFSIERNGRSP